MVMLYDLIKRQDTLKYFFNKIQLLSFSYKIMGFFLINEFDNENTGKHSNTTLFKT